jgi:hypothetical protein
MERFKWWVADRRDAIKGSSDAKLVLALGLLAVLAAGGYIAAGKISQAGAGTTGSSDLVRLVRTVRQPVTVRIHGRKVVRWRVRREVVQARAQTVLQTQTVRTPGGTKVITRPVVIYRKQVVTRRGKPHTVVVAKTVTDSQTSTVSKTSTVSQISTVSRTQTNVQTVTQPVTVVQTQTVTSTVTEPAVTVTVTLPLP